MFTSPGLTRKREEFHIHIHRIPWQFPIRRLRTNGLCAPENYGRHPTVPGVFRAANAEINRREKLSAANLDTFAAWDPQIFCLLSSSCQRTDTTSCSTAFRNYKLSQLLSTASLPKIQLIAEDSSLYNSLDATSPALDNSFYMTFPSWYLLPEMTKKPIPSVVLAFLETHLVMEESVYLLIL